MNKTEKRVPEKVKDQLEEHQSIILSSVNSIESDYLSKVEYVRNGVILHNYSSTRVFKYSEMLDILKGTHERWKVIK